MGDPKEAEDKVRPPSEEEIWERYMSRPRSQTDILSLLTDNKVKPGFRDRALHVFFDPINQPSVRVKMSNSPGVNPDWREILTEDQAIKAAQIVGEQLQGQNRENHAGSYSSLAITLLPKLPPQQAEELFSHYVLKDPNSYNGVYIQGPSYNRYDAIDYLYCDPAIDERFKIRAARVIREDIEKQQKGEVKPPTEREWDAFECYAAILYHLSSYESLPVTTAFYDQEIDFLLKGDQERHIVPSFGIARMMRLITNSDLRHEFARRHILTAEERNKGFLRGSRFRVYANKDAEFAREIIEEFPDDEDLTSYLTSQLAIYDQTLQEEAEKRQMIEQDDEAIMASIRRSGIS